MWELWKVRGLIKRSSNQLNPCEKWNSLSTWFRSYFFIVDLLYVLWMDVISATGSGKKSNLLTIIFLSAHIFFWQFDAIFFWDSGIPLARRGLKCRQFLAMCDWCDMHTCITPHHSPISYPFNHKRNFCSKIHKPLRELFAFYTSRKFTLFTKQHYFTENRKKEKNFLIHWKSDFTL